MNPEYSNYTNQMSSPLSDFVLDYEPCIVIDFDTILKRLQHWNTAREKYYAYPEEETADSCLEEKEDNVVSARHFGLLHQWNKREAIEIRVMLRRRGIYLSVTKIKIPMHWTWEIECIEGELTTQTSLFLESIKSHMPT